MAGWGTYTPLDGCFQRVRYTGDPVQLPVAFHAHENGVLVTFSRPVDRDRRRGPRAAVRPGLELPLRPRLRLARALARATPASPGHDPLAIRSATVLDDGRTLFLEIPDLQPVNQLHLHLRLDGGRPVDLFATVHQLGRAVHRLPRLRARAQDDRRPPDPRRPGRPGDQADARTPGPAPIAGARSIRDRGGQEPDVLAPDLHRPGRASRSS